MYQVDHKLWMFKESKLSLKINSSNISLKKNSFTIITIIMYICIHCIYKYLFIILIVTCMHQAIYYFKDNILYLMIFILN